MRAAANIFSVFRLPCCVVSALARSQPLRLQRTPPPPVDMATTDQLTMDQREKQEGDPSVARRASRESREYSGANQAGSGLMNGEAIVVNMSRLADVLGEWLAAAWAARPAGP